MKNLNELLHNLKSFKLSAIIPVIAIVFVLGITIALSHTPTKLASHASNSECGTGDRVFCVAKSDCSGTNGTAGGTCANGVGVCCDFTNADNACKPTPGGNATNTGNGTGTNPAIPSPIPNNGTGTNPAIPSPIPNNCGQDNQSRCTTATEVCGNTDPNGETCGSAGAGGICCLTSTIRETQSSSAGTQYTICDGTTLEHCTSSGVTNGVSSCPQDKWEYNSPQCGSFTSGPNTQPSNGGSFCIVVGGTSCYSPCYTTNSSSCPSGLYCQCAAPTAIPTPTQSPSCSGTINGQTVTGSCVFTCNAGHNAGSCTAGGYAGECCTP